MASPDVLDIPRLLAPITEYKPVGEDARQDPSPVSKYQQLKTARAAARAAERRAVHDGDNTEAEEHWRKIISLAPEFIATQSKDLEVSSWLVEALIRKHGFAGLKDGFKLLIGLTQNYWADIYPLPDEDDIETRTAPLSGLNGEGADGVLIVPIRKVPITEGFTPGPFSLWQYQQALDLSRTIDENAREAKLYKLGFSMEDIARAVEDSSSDYYLNLLDDLDQSIAIYKELGTLLDELCGSEYAPPTRNIIAALEECRGAVAHIGKDKLPTTDSTQTEIADTETSEQSAKSASTQTQQGKTPAAETYTREIAFKELLEIAKFFKKTEPHSPISYAIEKAVKWGNMTLNELINELIPDSSSRERYGELTGVKDEE
jgi:type VI secretion system protein ImpA